MDYQQIINLALSYSDRTDSDIVNRMADFISIVEARMNRAVRVNHMATNSVLITIDGQEQFGLPLDFAGIRDIKVREQGATRGTTAHYLNPEQMNDTIDDTQSIYYTIMANQIYLFPAQNDKILEIVYYKLIEALLPGERVNTNWVSNRYPDCYVFGLLVEIESFVKNVAGAEMWNKRFESAIAEIVYEDSVDRWSGTPLTIKVG